MDSGIDVAVPALGQIWKAFDNSPNALDRAAVVAPSDDDLASDLGCLAFSLDDASQLRALTSEV
jgi:hypothetical protein